MVIQWSGNPVCCYNSQTKGSNLPSASQLALNNRSLLNLGYDPAGNPPNYGKADKIVVENTNDIKEHDSDWNEIAEKVKSLSKKDTMPRGGKHDDIKDFDQ